MAGFQGAAARQPSETRGPTSAASPVWELRPWWGSGVQSLRPKGSTANDERDPNTYWASLRSITVALPASWPTAR